MNTVADAIAEVERNREAMAERARVDADNIAGAYRRLFATPDGEVVFNDLRRRFVDVPIARPAYGAEYAFFREGRRTVVAFVYQMKEGVSLDASSSSGSSGPVQGGTDGLFGGGED